MNRQFGRMFNRTDSPAGGQLFTRVCITGVLQPFIPTGVFAFIMDEAWCLVTPAQNHIITEPGETQTSAGCYHFGMCNALACLFLGAFPDASSTTLCSFAMAMIQIVFFAGKNR